MPISHTSQDILSDMKMVHFIEMFSAKLVTTFSYCLQSGVNRKLERREFFTLTFSCQTLGFLQLAYLPSHIFGSIFSCTLLSINILHNDQPLQHHLRQQSLKPDTTALISYMTIPSSSSQTFPEEPTVSIRSFFERFSMESAITLALDFI